MNTHNTISLVGGVLLLALELVVGLNALPQPGLLASGIFMGWVVRGILP